MRKILRLLSILLLVPSISFITISCAPKVEEPDVQEVNSQSDEIPKESFAAQHVLGLSSGDERAFADAMQNAGWTPQITCLENYCDIGTKEHFKTPATVVFLSGHGYVDDAGGYFNYSTLDAQYHKDVDRSKGATDSYSYKNERIWSADERYASVVAHHQKQSTDWLIIAACNQLRDDTRVDIFEEMNKPSEQPLKAVLGYGSYQGSTKDELVLQKFVELCTDSSGKQRVAHAWFAAHEAYAPTLASRVRVALRDGFQYATFTSPEAKSEDADNLIRLWWMSRGDVLPEPVTDIADEVIVEVELNETVQSNAALLPVEIISPDNIDDTQFQAVSAIEQESLIPADEFQLYRTNTIIESDMDGENEVVVSTLHIFARYLNGIRISVDPIQGEYLSIMMDGTDTAELDWDSRCGEYVNTDNAVTAASNTLISRDDAVTQGLVISQQLQRENYGYAPEELALKSIEPIYVVSPEEPQKLILAWNIVDDQSVYVIMDARSGEMLYWSD